MKKFTTADGYLNYIEQELEAANHHDNIELPRALFDKIVNLDHPDEIELARVIAEVFDKSI